MELGALLVPEPPLPLVVPVPPPVDVPVAPVVVVAPVAPVLVVVGAVLVPVGADAVVVLLVPVVVIGAGVLPDVSLVEPELTVPSVDGSEEQANDRNRTDQEQRESFMRLVKHFATAWTKRRFCRPPSHTPPGSPLWALDYHLATRARRRAAPELQSSNGDVLAGLRQAVLLDNAPH